MDKKQKNADIIAVAKAARVSPSTVSRSFNHPDLVKASTRKKIDNAVRKLGYIRNRAAQTIHGIRSGTIGLVVPTIDHTIFAELIQSFSVSIDRFGFTILLASHGYDLQREYALVRKMLEHRVDGVALIGLEHADETFALIERQAIPSILLWNHSDRTALRCVGTNNYSAGNIIGTYIVEQGHSDIALIFPPIDGNDRAAQRYRGVLAAIEGAGLSIPEAWNLKAPYSVAGAKAAAAAILRGDSTPSALICGNDVQAWGALNAASRFNISIPDELSVTGIGDFKGSKDLEPALTTVRIPARQIGSQAAITIARAITEPDTAVVSQNIEPELMVRGTCAAIQEAPSRR